MEIDKIIDELIGAKILDLEKCSCIRGSKLRTMISTKYNFDFSLKEISECLKKIENLVEIDMNFFVPKLKLKELLKDVSKNDYRLILENEYIIQIKDQYLLGINIVSERKSFDEILRYGLNNHYVEGEWLKDINIEESCFVDIYEVIEELENRGIKIK